MAVAHCLFGLSLMLGAEGTFARDGEGDLQKVVITMMDDNNDHAQYCLDLAGGRTENGTPIQLWECLGNANQEWIVQDFQIKSAVNTSKCIDAGDMMHGTNLKLWDCNGLPQQSWTKRAKYESWGNEAESYQVFLSSSTNKCLELANSSSNTSELDFSNGAAILLGSCINDQHIVPSSSLWYGLEGPVLSFEDRWVSLAVDEHSDYCLDLAGQQTANGTPIQIWQCNPGLQGQTWLLTAEGQIRSAVNSSKCIVVGPAVVDDKTYNLELSDCSPTDRTRWEISGSNGLQPNYTASSFRLTKFFWLSPGPHLTFCVNVKRQANNSASRFFDGAPVQLIDCTCGYHSGCPKDIVSWDVVMMNSMSMSSPIIV